MQAAEEDEDTIAECLHNADMVFVTAGMGGGTGTGAAPIVARLARKAGALTVGIVTKPFHFECDVRVAQAKDGVAALQDAVDTLIVIPNERLLDVVPPDASIQDAFAMADNVLCEATRGIYDIIAHAHQVNLDFADVRAVMKDMGVALMGTGRAEGEDRAVTAAQAAINSPLLEDIDINGAQGVLVNVLGAKVGIAETSAAMHHIQQAVGNQAHVIFGYGIDDSLGDTLQVTVIATGFQHGRNPARASETPGMEDIPAASVPEPPEPVTVTPAAARVAAATAAPLTTATLAASAAPEPVVDTPVAPVAAETVPPDAAPLREMAAAGGSEVSTDANETAGPTQSSEVGALHRFLRPVSTQPVASKPVKVQPVVEREEVELPENTHSHGPATAVFRSDALVVDDMHSPAYTRKYMD